MGNPMKSGFVKKDGTYWPKLHWMRPFNTGNTNNWVMVSGNKKVWMVVEIQKPGVALEKYTMETEIYIDNPSNPKYPRPVNYHWVIAIMILVPLGFLSITLAYKKWRGSKQPTKTNPTEPVRVSTEVSAIGDLKKGESGQAGGAK
jgi:hypothetical protein